MKQYQQKIADILEPPRSGNPGSHYLAWTISLLILLNVVTISLETVDWIAVEYGRPLYLFELFSVAVFTVEYIARIWSAPAYHHNRYSHPLRGRLHYLLSPMALIDLIAIAPFYLSLLTGVDLRMLRLLRLPRFLKILRYSNAMETLSSAIRKESGAILAALLLMVLLLITASALLYYIEGDVQPENFSSIPAAMWWAMATITTVGYGDVTPITPVGKVVGAVIMMVGVGMFALYTGILATAFTQEQRQRDFLKVWNMVASVPLFRGLSAAEIAEITKLLRPRTVMPHETIIKEGERADGMSFIISGEVEVNLHPTPVRLGSGNFFGEMAIVLGGKRRATVHAIHYTELLDLSILDLEGLFKKRPDLMKQVQETARQREQGQLS